jgi:hypothetical protein
MDEKKDPHASWLKWLPLVAVILAILALTFQVTVLHPWHEALAKQFSKHCRCGK